ncbi:MAG: D-alanyl-D-alanine carboxypeptidase, partial [Rhodospirillaceae bacterium]
PVRDPGRRTALAFRWLAQATGTRLPAPVPGTAPAEARELTAVDSLPLLRILPPALNYSNNMVSELVGLAAARKLGGRPETLAQSSRRLIDWLAAGVPALDPNGLDLPNHSGLAAAARVTPRQMLTVVRHGLLMRYGADGVLPVLPAGGWRDALAGRFRDPDIAGRVWAKSGTLHYASGLVGVFFGQASGRRTIFALYVMDDAARDGYDADPNRETPAVQAAAEIWIDRAKAFEENLLGVWNAAY